MVRHVTTTNYCYGIRFARDRFLTLKEQLFSPIQIKNRPLTTTTTTTTKCVLTNRKNSTFSSAEIQNSFSHSLPSESHCRRLFHQTASSSSSSTQGHLPSIFPLSQQQLGKLGYLSDVGRPNKPSTWVTRHFSSNHTPPIVSFSSISETPLDSNVMEKPYTVILMEDDVSASFFHSNEPNCSWSEIFRSNIPRDYGMSFASISLQLKTLENTTTSISTALEALKASRLPMVADAILVARGPCSSLIAQYYLESFSLQGLVMMDPILLQQQEKEKDEKLLSSLVSEIYKNDDESLERFHSRRLLVEANSVPMMVVRTISETDDNDDHYPEWKSSSVHVAQRHGDADGLYGEVPVLDVVDNKDEKALVANLLQHIGDWIDQDL